MIFFQALVYDLDIIEKNDEKNGFPILLNRGSAGWLDFFEDSWMIPKKNSYFMIFMSDSRNESTQWTRLINNSLYPIHVNISLWLLDGQQNDTKARVKM